MASDRPSTPPRTSHSGRLPPNPQTPEQVRRTEEARLKAKAIRERDEAAARARGELVASKPGSVAGQKRPYSSLSTVPSTQRDGRANNASPAKLAAATGSGSGMSKPPVDDTIRPAKKFEKYIEYDFSTMTDTKGGFLSAQDDPNVFARAGGVADDAQAGEQKPAHMTLAEWERSQLLKKLRAQRQGPFEPGISVMNKDAASKTCRECGSMEIDWQWLDVFKIGVCGACKDKYPEKYSLLTKTEAREDYLLTNPELQDTDLFGWLEKPNPHKSTWNNMQLYLRFQVEDYAFSEKRWGSAEALDAEFERREDEKRKRKEKKFKSRLEDLKRKTMVEAYKRGKEVREKGMAFGSGSGAPKEKHEHEWGRPVEDPETGLSLKRCVGCGMEIEEVDL